MKKEVCFYWKRRWVVLIRYLHYYTSLHTTSRDYWWPWAHHTHVNSVGWVSRMTYPLTPTTQLHRPTPRCQMELNHLWRMVWQQNWSHAAYWYSASRSLVTLPEACGVGAEDAVWTVQVKNAKSISDIAPPSLGWTTDCYRPKAMASAHNSDCIEQRQTSPSKTPLCLHQGRGNRKKTTSLV